MCFIAPLDYCVEYSLVDETSCKIALISYWNDCSLNSFLEIRFLELKESYEKMQKIQMFKILRAPSIRNNGVCV